MKMISEVDSEGQLVTIQITDDDGQIRKKTVTLETYINFCNSVVKDDIVGYRLGKMPRGYYDARMSLQGSNTFSVVVVLPPQKSDVFYEEAHFTVPFPTLAFNYCIEKGKVTKSYCFALEEDMDWNDDTMLYHYPYTNVYDNGKVCWGGNILPLVNQLQDIDALTALFFSAKCNDDLFTPENMLTGCNRFKGNVRAFFTEMGKYDTFPKKFLKAVDRKLGDII